ncbi:MAG: hypothetical protein HPY76_02370 [Anaerolineae bacterium]|nr:hypothetical protein [Anaerolineae bacterium]
MLASIVIIGVAVLVVLSATGGNPGFKPWSDLSVMWILIPIILVSLAGIVVLGYLNFGIAKAIAFIPSVALKTQTFFYTMAVTIRKYADKSVTPFFAWHESGAALKSLFK